MGRLRGTPMRRSGFTEVHLAMDIAPPFMVIGSRDGLTSLRKLSLYFNDLPSPLLTHTGRAAVPDPPEMEDLPIETPGGIP